jgi:D-beta-D-heptose 7-phosphate kinase/D-beta-D-heptose 1-phosphate adenosyltransferase
MKLELPDFSRAQVLVAGDVMLDRYWQGAAGRISPEAPVPVVRVREEQQRPGGAGNVALNVAALGARAALLGCVGDDADGNALAMLLARGGVRNALLTLPGWRTIAKLRVLAQHHQLIRLDFEDPLPQLPAGDWMAAFNRELEQAGAVVLSDYGKGVLAQVPALIAAARARGLPVVVDPKGRDFSPYRGATVITPNLHEFQEIAGPAAGDAAIAEKGEALRAALGLEALLVTRGEQGMSLLAAGQPPLHLPTQAREVFDVTGAGDTVVAVLAAALAAGAALPQAVALANAGAGVVVGKLGTATLSAPELRRALHGPGGGQRILGEDALLEAVAEARAHGETVVMTNGCFDILHAGHARYLEQAAQLGDRLIVAVNADATVRALKGADRPVNPLEQRMAMLAALAAVDWVVPFSEETPARLICAVKPDILVKGGDNDPLRVPGGDCVRAAGGEVRVLDYVDGVSTTGIIARMRERG